MRRMTIFLNIKKCSWYAVKSIEVVKVEEAGSEQKALVKLGSCRLDRAPHLSCLVVL